MIKNKSTKKLNTEAFISKASKIHEDKYDYSKVYYKRSRDKVNIICRIHGEFLQKAGLHLEGSGCKLCANSYIGKLNTKNTEDFIIKSKTIHKSMYEYNKATYTQSKNKVVIVCKIHGDFLQTPSLHLLGHGCPSCGREAKLGRSGFINKAKERVCAFYTIRCFNKEEEFYKIGITMRSINERYKNTTTMPYSYEIISEINGEAGFIWDLELENKQKLKEFHYTPVISFAGSSTECFTKYKI